MTPPTQKSGYIKRDKKSARALNMQPIQHGISIDQEESLKSPSAYSGSDNDVTPNQM